MTHIPNEIIRLVLLKLHLNFLIRFQLVCKEWRSMIHDPGFKLSYNPRRPVVVIPQWTAFNFKSMHRHPRIKYIFVFDGGLPFPNTWGIDYKDSWSGVWCSCNGFVLFSIKQHIFLRNMSTQCYTKVLELQCLGDLDLSQNYIVSGLCYVSSTRDYKVVLLIHHRPRNSRPNPPEHGYFLVASLRDKKWHKLPFPYIVDSVRDGFEFQCTLHWTVIDSGEEWSKVNWRIVKGESGSSKEWNYMSRSNKVIYFDPECDEFRELPIPESMPWGEGYEIAGLGIIDDCLCMARRPEERFWETEVLVMKEYNRKESWVRKFVVLNHIIGWNYPNMKFYSSKYNSEVLIWSYGLEKWKISVYHLKDNTLNTIPEEKFEGKGSEGPVGICSYVQSFASPDEFIWRHDQHKDNPED